jgi:hypothetical protein
MLNDTFVEKYYQDGDFKKYKGFRLLAIDGCCMEVPNTNELRKHYGCATNHSSKLQVPRALSSTLYDIENKVVINSLLGRYADDERDHTLRNIDKLKSPNQGGIQDLILFDRGYPSMEFIMDLNERG